MMTNLFKKLNNKHLMILKGKLSKLRRICCNLSAKTIQSFLKGKITKKKLFINIICFYALNIIFRRKLCDYKSAPYLNYQNFIKMKKIYADFKRLFLNSYQKRLLSSLKSVGVKSNSRFNNNLFKLQRWIRTALIYKRFKSGNIQKKIISIKSMFTDQLANNKMIKKCCFVRWKNYVKFIAFNSKALVIQSSMREYIKRLKFKIRQKHFCEFLKYILVKIACNEVKSLKIKLMKRSTIMQEKLEKLLTGKQF